MRKFKALSMVAVAAIVVIALLSSTTRKTTIFMVGDSTMANKNIDGGKKERGWGMVLKCFFDDDIVIDNHAVNGRSSKSFIDEGRWDAVKSRIQKGDYVVIQFGHNDEKLQPARHTEPGTTFDANLRKMVRETRECGGIPILMNAVARRNFYRVAPENKDDEKLRNTVGNTASPAESDTLYDTHGAYLLSPRNVARETGAIFIDANRITSDLEQSLGKDKSKKLHMWFLPGEEPSVPQGRQDNTHYNVYGAHVVARLLSKTMAKEFPQLARHLVDDSMVSVSKDGAGDYMDLQEAVDAAPDGKSTIQLFAGEWHKPNVPKGKTIKYVLRDGAKLY